MDYDYSVQADNFSISILDSLISFMNVLKSLLNLS